ncbi:MAG: metallophosphoesterase family protein [Thermodesulfobacteriota bacterium]
MKILILSDIHANWYALEAILDKESYDSIIFLGDVVDFGPSPKNCIKFLMKSSKARFWGVRGDHDHAMAYGINSKCPSELHIISAATREWGEGFLSSEEVGFLRRLPIHNEFSIDSMNFELVHGVDIDITQDHPENIDHISSAKRDEAGLNYILVGHSHKPYIKSLGTTVILNPGSVGQPRDLNPRASYAVIDDGVPYIRRVSYDIERTVNDLNRSKLPKAFTNQLSSMLYSGGRIN